MHNNNKNNEEEEEESLWDILPDDIKIIIIRHKSANIIKNYALKMFYKKYGIYWQMIIKNYEDWLDSFCLRYNVCDPYQDYINYYREESLKMETSEMETLDRTLNLYCLL